MDAELQPPSSGSPIANSLAGAAAPQNAPPQQTDNLGPNLAPKRHRRPSVRLGDIGGQPATFRTSKPWKLNPHRETPNTHNHKPSSKTRPLTNLVTSVNGNFDYSSAETPATTTNNGHRKFPKDFKSKRSNNSKRVRTNFRIDPEEEYDEGRENGGNINDNDNHGFHDVVAVDDDDDDNREEGFRDFDPEIDDDSGPDVRSPANSRDDIELHPDMWPAHNRRSIRANTRFSNDLGMESDSRNQRIGLDDGIKKWLVELGLGRYSPVFEIHEVDEEVLPYLTLEDLKDMGINAVGSRRKLFSAIQKLRKGLS
ncbi:unnamed protein product [Amaranthus hypochondriacus]